MPVRTLEDVGRRLKRADAILARLSDSDRRMEIIEKEYLRRDIARESAFREKHPRLWGELEQARKSRNRRPPRSIGGCARRVSGPSDWSRRSSSV